ncbi:CoA transferase [Alcanivorax sp. IL1]|uniref:CoA transferase n=1 Tax=Alcanivorax sp. IL1 TaxID=3396308 RepID=UPI0039C13889
MTRLAADPKKLRRLMIPVRWAIQLILLTRTRDQWDARLAHKDTCVSGILTLEEALANEQVQARGLVTDSQKGPVLRSPIRFVGAQTRDGESPSLGEHNPLFTDQDKRRA